MHFGRNTNQCGILPVCIGTDDSTIGRFCHGVRVAVSNRADPKELHKEDLGKPELWAARSGEKCVFVREGLIQLNHGCGRDLHIFFSAVDYEVEPDDQNYQGKTEELKGPFP